ncbi:GNAT family N-acetyltransferase [Candidatus Pelagibacter sp. HIMB1485]|uniref:GNAT family N-acetyltransferase n=1 Tax=Candidatus Pelagibacter sp. HIMB1485 TaxID=3415415 RepID=UPI003F827CA4
MNITYRKLKFFDAEKIRIWRNNQIKVLRQNEKIKKQEQKVYFKKNILLKNPKLDLFAIDLNQKLIGYAGLVNISSHFKTAEVSFLIDDKIKHNSNIYQKIFNHFLLFIKEYSFTRIKLRRLYTETFSFRKKHIMILENSGFKLEGIMKKHVIKNKQAYDSLIHGILKK